MQFREYLKAWWPENSNQAIVLSSLLFIVVWITLKLLGIIQTPLIVEMMPLFAAVFAAGAFFSEVRRMFVDIHAVRRELKELLVQGNKNEWQHKEINKRLARLEQEAHAH